MISRRADSTLSPAPLVIIYLAVFQAEQFIRDTLSSIAAQSYGDFRCIVSDDASDDGTARACKEFARHDNRFVVMENRQRLGWIGNVNRLLTQAEGDFFMIASHDDVISPGYVEALLSALRDSSRNMVAFSDMSNMFEDATGNLASYITLESATSQFQRAAGVISEQGPWWIPYHGLVRRSLLNEPPRLRYNMAGEFSADLPWVLNLAICGPFVRVPKSLYAKYQKENSVSRQWKFTPAEHAAVMTSCAGVVWRSGMPLIQRCVLLALILFRFARKLAWDGSLFIRGMISGSATINPHET